MSTLNLKKVEGFANRLRHARLAKGWSQEDLANKLDVSNGSVGNWESGPTIPRPVVLRKIAALFEVEVEDFLSKAQSEEPKMYILAEAKSSGRFPSLETCREYFANFLATCKEPEQIGWTYYELQEKFPLNKFSSRPPSELRRIVEQASERDDDEHHRQS